MRGTGSVLLPALGAAVIACLLPAPAAAQLPDWTQGWDSRVTIYAWLPSITGSQERRDGQPVIDLDSANVIDALNFAFFGAAEVRRGKLGMLFDLEIADLSADGDWLDQALSAEVKTDFTMATAAVSYRVYEANAAFVDVFGGARVYDVDASFNVQAGPFGRTVYADANWVDPLIGVRGSVPIRGAFSASGFVAAGGFGIGDGSEGTWDVYGGVNYAFTDTISGLLGYRYMSIDYASTDLTMDIEMYGPLLGVAFSF